MSRYMMENGGFITMPEAEGQVESRVYAMLRAADGVGTAEAWDAAVDTAYSLWVVGGFNPDLFGAMFPHAKHYLRSVVEYVPGQNAVKFAPENWVVATGLQLKEQQALTFRVKLLWAGIGLGIGYVIGVSA